MGLFYGVTPPQMMTATFCTFIPAPHLPLVQLLQQATFVPDKQLQNYHVAVAVAISIN
jgi:hypothetical protein